MNPGEMNQGSPTVDRCSLENDAYEDEHGTQLDTSLSTKTIIDPRNSRNGTDSTEGESSRDDTKNSTSRIVEVFLQS